MIRRILRKTVLMCGVLAVFFGLVWVLQANDVFPDDGMISSDPRLFSKGIVLAVAGVIAVFVARRI